MAIGNCSVCGQLYITHGGRTVCVPCEHKKARASVEVKGFTPPIIGEKPKSDAK